jgi:hypothetical protein
MVTIAEREFLSEATDTYVDAMVGRAAAAQKEIQTWSEDATEGGTSTTDNVTYTHLLNVKRVAYSIPPWRISVLRRLKEVLLAGFGRSKLRERATGC